MIKFEKARDDFNSCGVEKRRVAIEIADRIEAILEGRRMKYPENPTMTSIVSVNIVAEINKYDEEHFRENFQRIFSKFISYSPQDMAYVVKELLQKRGYYCVYLYAVKTKHQYQNLLACYTMAAVNFIFIFVCIMGPMFIYAKWHFSLFNMWKFSISAACIEAICYAGLLFKSYMDVKNGK